MTPMLRIRKEVLGLTQAEMAALTGVQQATVSRWEKGGLEPNREQMERIRSSAQSQGKNWDDSWFFDAPAQEKPRKRKAA